MKFFKFKKPVTKWLLLLGAAVLIVVGVVIGVSSCSRASYFQIALDNLSETRLYMKQAENEKYRVQFYAGMREEPYAVNGISEKKVAFGVVNLESRGKLISEEEIQGTLFIGEEEIPVRLERNPHGTNFAYDIEKLIDADKPLALTLFIGETAQEFTLENAMPEDAINWERALEIATDEARTQIKDAGRFECFVKIVESPVKDAGSFWYIRFVPEKGNNFFVVIDPTGKVVN
jgi:hypothetical protein